MPETSPYLLPTQIRPLSELQHTIEEQVLLSVEQRNQMMAPFKEPITFSWLVETALDRNDQYSDYLPYFVTDAYIPVWLKQNTKPVFFDSEFIALSDATEDIGFGIGVTIDFSGAIRYWPQEQVSELLAYLGKHDEVVTYSGLHSDNRILVKAGGNERQIQELYNRSFDLAHYIVANSSFRMKHIPKLETVAQHRLQTGKLNLYAMDIEGPGDIPYVLAWGTPEQKDFLWWYCFRDAWLVMRLYENLQITLPQKLRVFDYETYQLAHDIDILKPIAEISYGDGTPIYEDSRIPLMDKWCVARLNENVPKQTYPELQIPEEYLPNLIQPVIEE